MCTAKHKPVKVAFAGTHGKSMSGLLLKHLLNKGNLLGEGDFIESFPLRNSLPRLMAMKEAAEAGWLAVEISPEGLHHGLYKDMYFDLMVLTNLFPRQRGTIPQHRYLALHRNFMAAMPKDGISVVNADDPLSLESADVAEGKVITYALHYPKAMVTAANYKPLPLGSSFDVVINGDLPSLAHGSMDTCSFPVRLPLPGEVGVYTALAAVTAALVLGMREETLLRGLKSFTGLKRRLEFLHADDIHVIDDIAPSSIAVKALLGSLTALRFQRIFLILGIEKGEKRALTEIALELLRQEKNHPLTEIYVTTCTEHLSASQSSSRSEEQAFLKVWRQGKGRAPVALFRSLIPALQEAILSLHKGDLLLLLGGKGMNPAGRLLSIPFREDFPDQDTPHIAEDLYKQWSILNPT